MLLNKSLITHRFITASRRGAKCQRSSPTKNPSGGAIEPGCSTIASPSRPHPNKRGSFLDLIQRELQTDQHGALDWLTREGLLPGETARRTPQNPQTGPAPASCAIQNRQMRINKSLTLQTAENCGENGCRCENWARRRFQLRTPRPMPT